MPTRRRLPPDRIGLTAKRSSGNTEFYLTVNFYPGTSEPGEVFLVLSKTGSDMGGMADLWATSVSLALQFGVPWPTLEAKFLHTRFGMYSTPDDPSVGHAFAKTISELIAAKAAIDAENNSSKSS